jgi:hypothetical protein
MGRFLDAIAEAEEGIGRIEGRIVQLSDTVAREASRVSTAGGGGGEGSSFRQDAPARPESSAHLEGHRAAMQMVQELRGLRDDLRRQDHVIGVGNARDRLEGF